MKATLFSLALIAFLAAPVSTLAAAKGQPMKILLRYGTHAKAVIPELTRIADCFEKDEKGFPKHLMALKAKSVRETILAIEATTDSPTLIRLK